MLLETLAGGALLAGAVIVFWMVLLMLVRGFFHLLRRDVQSARRLPGWVWFVSSLLAVMSINSEVQWSRPDGMRLAASDVSVLAFLVIAITLLVRAVVRAIRDR